MTILERIFARTHREGACRIWDGAKSPRGYGRIGVPGRTQVVSRLVYEEVFGPVSSALAVCHHCDVPSCVEPAHLFVGTIADNNADKVRKGRHRGPNRGRTLCRRGHEFTPENTYTWRGHRTCIACRRAYQAPYARQRRRSKQIVIDGPDARQVA